MIYIVISIVLFFAMALFPITYSLIVLKKRTSEELIIPTLLVDDPKYFTDLYRSAFRSKLAAMDSENIVEYTFKPSEKIVEADKTIEYPVICNYIIYAENYDFVPPEGMTFNKEIYANKNVYLVGVKTLLGIYCKKNLLIGSGIDIIRWVDSGGEITVEDNCSLGIITTSNTRIITGENCLFARMLAPQIFLGFTKDTDFKTVSKALTNNEDYVSQEVIRNIKSVDDDITDENQELHKSIITKYDLSILDGMKVKGSIRSHKTIRVGDNAIVYGNVFAEGDIYLGKGSRILGNIFTQNNIYTEENVEIGQNGKIKSIIAKEKISFSRRCVVYGYIESGNVCEVCLDEQ